MTRPTLTLLERDSVSIEAAKVKKCDQRGQELRMSYLSPKPDNTNKPKLITRVREAIRTRHYSLRTKEAYVQWIQGVK